MTTKDVADFIISTNFERLPSNITAQAKKVIRDILGVSLAARKDTAVEAARRVATAMNGSKEATLIGSGIKVPCNIGAWVNGIMASTLDMDDGAMGIEGHRGHPGAVVVPSALAMAERQNATGKSLIEAVVVGYEIALRTGWIMALAEGAIPVASGTIGTYGAAAAAAKLLGLSKKEIINALGIAEAHCPFPSSDTALEKMAMTKESCGWGAMTGVTAVLLAKAGFGGPLTMYDLDKYDKNPLQTLGKEWEILGVYFKPYSTCRLLHAAIDGVLDLTKEHKINVDDILKITVAVGVHAGAMTNYRPSDIWQAQYSIPFAIGAALLDREVGPEQIAKNRLTDKTILRQADKVELVDDPEVRALFPAVFAGRVTIEMKDSKKYETLKRYPRGEPQNPLSEEELAGKFRKLAAKALASDEIELLSTCLDRLEDYSIGELMGKLVGER